MSKQFKSKQPKKEVHFSLDMEVLAVKATCPAILSLGIVEFDPDKVQTPDEISENFHLQLFFSLDGQTEKYGRVIESDTLEWWLEQDASARGKLVAGLKGGVAFPAAIAHLNHWLAGVLEGYADVSSAHSHAIVLPELHVWSYGAKSDLVWWNTACEAVGEPYPVHYHNEECLRQLAKSLPQVPRVTFGDAHDALDDAIAQAAWAQQLRAKLRDLKTTDTWLEAAAQQ